MLIRLVKHPNIHVQKKTRFNPPILRGRNLDERHFLIGIAVGIAIGVEIFTTDLGIIEYRFHGFIFFPVHPAYPCKKNNLFPNINL